MLLTIDPQYLPKAPAILIMLMDDEYLDQYGTVDHPAHILKQISTVFDSCKNKIWDIEKQIAKFEKVVVKKHPDLVAYADMLIANPEFVSNWLLSMGWENE